VFPAATPTRPCVSDRCWVWQDAPPALGLLVGAVEEVVCFTAVVGVSTLGDAVEGSTCDEPDGDGTAVAGAAVEDPDVEAHPVSSDVVITMSPATAEIECFIRPPFINVERYPKMTHS
jgi:hypothetical protein